MENKDHYISNHYHCQICHSDVYGLRFFKKINDKWVESSENDSEIAMEYCLSCKCDERVHESEFLDPKWEDGKRPFIHLFWDIKKRQGFNKKISARLYEEIFPER